MSSTVRWLGFFAGLCFSMPAMAGESAALKCSGSQDRVWLYDSLVSFEVQAKLKCGDTVEILAREKAFVKIRTQSGAEGYVPDVALPKPLTEEARQEKPVAELSLAEQARAARAARTSSASAVASSSSAAPATVAAAPTSDRAAESKIAVAQERPAESLQPVAVSSNSSNAGSVSVITVEASVTPSNTPAASQPPAIATSHPAAGSTDSSASKTSSQRNEKAAANKAKAAQPVPAKPVRPAPAPPSSTSSASNVAPPTPGNGQRAAMVASNSASTAPRTVTAVETNSVTLRSEPVATTRTVAATIEPESEDYPERLIEDESASPSCATYFSAYGLSPMQYKWIVENRRKKYPGICPASTPGKVDFVVILTHDVAFYNSTMPNPVHVDRNGFSDWNPMTRADDTVVSASELDKSKHEYVWVFQMKRGAFDPAKFSSRRRPQFTKAESNGLSSHAAPRSMDDAFQFMRTAPAR